MKLPLIAIVYLLSGTALAGVPSWLDSNKYKNGYELCEIEHPNKNELSHRIDVPVDYNNPTGPKFSLYFWSQKKFDLNLPTVIFVPGGPGNTAHGTAFDLPEWNVIFFDPRGNTCSRPKDYATYRNLNFFSSENTARDINRIRQNLNIDQVSIYGVSYGTVPATIYGHLFPESTRAILLEGVIFEGGPLLIEPERKQKILQKFFDHLDLSIQDRILKLSRKFPNWFSAMGANILYVDNPIKALEQVIKFIISQNDDVLIPFVSNFIPRTPSESSFGFDEMQMGVIGCHELGMNFEGLSPHLVFQGTTLIPEGKNYYIDYYCKPLNIPLNENSKTYSALNYRSQAAITYIQGTFDGATSALAAVKHFKSSQGQFKNLILVDQGGHLPSFGTLNSGYESGESVVLRQKLLSSALHGLPIENDLLKDLRSATSMHWTQTHKSPKN